LSDFVKKKIFLLLFHFTDLLNTHSSAPLDLNCSANAQHQRKNKTKTIRYYYLPACWEWGVV